MTCKITQIALIASVILVSLSAINGEERAAPCVSSDTQTLFLRNGQALAGRITRDEDLYLVDVGDGRMRIKAAEVDLVCDSLEDGYLRKRAILRHGNVHDHLDLAQWCLRQGLLKPAAAELADAEIAEPGNPAIKRLQHRLDMSLEPAPVEQKVAAATTGPSNEELDGMVRGLSRDTVEMFTQSVQPVLMNHCATGGCHGPQADNGLRILRISLGKSANRRVTQRNLHSALSCVNRDNPTASPLLTIPLGPHGTLEHAIFSEHQATQYLRLVQWAMQLEQGTEQDVPAAVDASWPVEPTSPGPAANPPRVLSKEARKGQPLNGAAPSRNGKQVAAADAARSTAASSEPCGDPFDPEVFNRRFATTPQKAAEKSAAPVAARSDADRP